MVTLLDIEKSKSPAALRRLRKFVIGYELLCITASARMWVPPSRVDKVNGLFVHKYQKEMEDFANYADHKFTKLFNGNFSVKFPSNCIWWFVCFFLEPNSLQFSAQNLDLSTNQRSLFGGHMWEGLFSGGPQLWNDLPWSSHFWFYRQLKTVLFGTVFD